MKSEKAQSMTQFCVHFYIENSTSSKLREEFFRENNNKKSTNLRSQLLFRIYKGNVRQCSDGLSRNEENIEEIEAILQWFGSFLGDRSFF